MPLALVRSPVSQPHTSILGTLPSLLNSPSNGVTWFHDFGSNHLPRAICPGMPAARPLAQVQALKARSLLGVAT